LLEQWGSGPNREALAGDLIEQYRRGRSPAWYWRQVLRAILVGAVHDIRDHTLLAGRALVMFWTASFLLNWFTHALRQSPFDGWAQTRLALARCIRRKPITSPSSTLAAPPNGQMFDSSVPRGEPARFRLDQLIPGWTEGLQLMVVGETRRLWIPEPLAYRGQHEPKGMLVFDVELLKIE
jgi:hypothetical protein